MFRRDKDVFDGVRAVFVGMGAEVLNCPALIYKELSGKKIPGYEEFRENALITAGMFDETGAQMGRAVGLLYSYIGIPVAILSFGSNLVRLITELTG